MTAVTVDVVSDVMCPWCYVGKRRLEAALAALPDEISVGVRWRPFQLDPTLPKTGKDRRAYLEEKFGGPERAEQAYAAIREAGVIDGIPFDFDAIEVSANTLDAHRLIRWAATDGGSVQSRLVDILFRFYFTEGRNIGDDAVLLEAAAEAGMDTAVVEVLLKGEADREAVAQEIATAREMGVTGVPCFILDGRYAVMGAQPAETLARALTDIAKAKRAEPNPSVPD